MSTAKWKIDWGNMIIFVSHKLTNKDFLALMNKLLQDERGLPSGPDAEWSILTVEDN